MRKTRAQLTVLNWRWWVCLVPVYLMALVIVVLAGIPWGIWCACKVGAEEFADKVFDPPVPIPWADTIIKWVRKGGE